MLMVDRISEMLKKRWHYNLGYIEAELDVKPDLWLDQSFKGDPVMPGCLGLDALWQLIGYFLVWNGNSGRGRALGAGEVKFFGQVLPSAKVTYMLNMKRLIQRKLVMASLMGMSRGWKRTYSAKNLKAGLFENTDNF